MLDRLLISNAPLLHGSLPSRRDMLVLLAISWLSSPLEPFSIELSDKVRQRALEDLAADFGFPRSWARTFTRSVREARSAHADASARGKRLGLAAVGLVAVAAAPALVIAAAPAGLGGGAAVAAGLAALGPGGMMGGIGVVGALGGAGGAAVTSALLSGSAESVAGNAIVLQAVALASRELHCSDPSHPEAAELVSMREALSEQLDLQRKFSDEDSDALKTAAAKLRSVDRALTWMDKHGLRAAALPVPGEAG